MRSRTSVLIKLVFLDRFTSSLNIVLLVKNKKNCKEYKTIKNNECKSVCFAAFAYIFESHTYYFESIREWKSKERTYKYT